MCDLSIVGLRTSSGIVGSPVGGDEAVTVPIRSGRINPAAQSIDDPKHTAATTRQTSHAPITSRLPRKKSAGWYHISSLYEK
jgi:hypothetical protein